MSEFRVVPILDRDPGFATYAERIAESQRKTRDWRPNPVKPKGISQEEFILSLQAGSTQRIMKMTPEEHKEHKNRANPTWASQPETNREAYLNLDLNDEESMDKMVKARKVSIKEITLEEARRRSPKNQEGQSTMSSVSSERREKGIAGLLYTPPAKLTAEEIARITKLTTMEAIVSASEPKKDKWIELKWYEALWHWIKGGSIKQEDDYSVSWRNIKDSK